MDLNQQRDDPHGVQRLLDILRRQQDASSSSAAPPSNPFATAPQPEADAHASSDAAAQRRRAYASSSSAYTPAEAPFDPYAFNPFSAANPVLDAPPAAPPKKDAPRDLASLSFAESLPILSGLAADEGLMRRLKVLRTQQRELERRLAKEYHQFAATKERQYPHVKQRKDEDHRRRADALAQWDKCLQAQQQELARAGVPTFVPTSDRRKVETQRKVLAVLVDMLDDQEPS